MKVMIHGAINYSNYGDYLFAEFFSYELIKRGIEVEYYTHPKYGISDFFAKNLGYSLDNKQNYAVMKSCDALVYISGGYFLSQKNLLADLRHKRRYLTPGLYFMNHDKPVYILGIGAGPFSNGPFRKAAKRLLQYATALTVRNEESKQHIIGLGVCRDIPVTTDTALVIRDYVRNTKTGIPRFHLEPGKKMLLFHIDLNHNVKSKLEVVVVPAIKRFLDTHKEYELYLAADSIMPDSLYEEYAHMFAPYSTHILKYNDPWALTRQIERADMVVTTKLHMGIVGAAFACSVISFPWHQKTPRFYKQIGEGDRCKLLSEVDEQCVMTQLERFEGKHISLPKELIEKAKLNLEMLPK